LKLPKSTSSGSPCQPQCVLLTRCRLIDLSGLEGYRCDAGCKYVVHSITVNELTRLRANPPRTCTPCSHPCSHRTCTSSSPSSSADESSSGSSSSASTSITQAFTLADAAAVQAHLLPCQSLLGLSGQLAFNGRLYHDVVFWACTATC
jgi:hypothetical protein